MTSVREQLLESKLVKIQYIKERLEWGYSDLFFRINTQGKLIITEVSMQDHIGRIKIYDLDPQIDAVQFDLSVLHFIPRVIGERQHYNMVVILREDATISLLLIAAINNKQGQERASRMIGNLELVLVSDNYRYYLFTNLATNITDIAIGESILLLDQDKLVHELTYQMIDEIISPQLSLVSDPSDPIVKIIPDVWISEQYIYRTSDFSEKVSLPDNCRILSDNLYILSDVLGCNIDQIGQHTFTLEIMGTPRDACSIKKIVGWNEYLANGQDNGQDCHVLDNEDKLWSLRYPRRFELCPHDVIDISEYRFNYCYIDADNNLHVMYANLPIIDRDREVFRIPDAGLLRGTHSRERSNWMRKRAVRKTEGWANSS